MSIHLPLALKTSTEAQLYLNQAYRFSIESGNKLLTLTNAIIGLSFRKTPLKIQDIYALEVSFSDLIAELHVIKDNVLNGKLLTVIHNE